MAEKKKEINPKKTPMPEQEPLVRIENFNEVALGYSVKNAIAEAERCLSCKKAPCVGGCPVEVDIPAFIQFVKEGDFLKAVKKIKEKNILPAICGRVCPQEDQCEKYCTLGKKYEPIAIGRLERFVADFEREKGLVEGFEVPKPNGKKVAVIGSGPSGLTVAGDLVKLGYDITIFEALHKPGGVLVYGIPEFRLPKKVVQAEIEFLQKMGVKIQTDVVVGKTVTIDELLNQEYQAVFIGIGAGLPLFMGIEGENLNGVYSANEFLTRVNLMKAYLFPEYDTPIKRGEKVAVVGGGNVALDSARTALRLGAKKVYLVYRRSEKEMPCRHEEFEHAKEEGVEFIFLTLPKRILSRGNGWVGAIECIKMILGEPDETGRRRPVPVSGSEFILDVDVVVVAIGTRANPLLPSTTPGLRLNEKGYIKINEIGRTSKKGVFAGGDIVTGSATVISAMGAGRTAARAIDEYLSK